MAARFLVPGGSGLWNNVNNWSLTSGGAAGASFPIAGDDAVLDVLSAAAPLTVNVASAALSLTGTGYTGTLTVTNVLTLTGGLTVAPSMVVTGAGGIVLNGTATITTGGVTIGCALSMQGAFTYTLVDNFTVLGLLSLSSGSSTTVLTGAFTINAAGGLTHVGVASAVNNTGAGAIPTIRISAAGTLTFPNNSTANFRVNLTIDAGGGTVTFFNGIFCFGGGTGAPTLTYTSGTVVMGGSGATIQINGNCTLTTAGIVWNKVATTLGQTVTLTNDLTMTGQLSLGTGTAAQIWNGANVNVGNGIAVTYTTGGMSGTTVFKLTGAGLLSSSGGWTGRFASPLVINASGAAIIITSVFNVDLGLVQFLAASSVTTSQGPWTITPAVIGTLSPPQPGGNARLTTDDQGSLRVIRSGPAVGPLSAPTNFANLLLRVDDQGSLVIAQGAAGSVVGPPTNASNIKLRVDSAGSLVVNS